MDAREFEAQLLERCVVVAGGSGAALNQCEANVFRVAAMVLQSRWPVASFCLMQASEVWFARHPQDLLPSREVVRAGWVVSLPRLRDMLSRQLSHQLNKQLNKAAAKNAA